MQKVIPRIIARTLRMKIGARLREAVEKAKRANNMTTMAEPMVASIMRNGKSALITAIGRKLARKSGPRAGGKLPAAGKGAVELEAMNSEG